MNIDYFRYWNRTGSDPSANLLTIHACIQLRKLSRCRQSGSRGIDEMFFLSFSSHKDYMSAARAHYQFHG